MSWAIHFSGIYTKNSFRWVPLSYLHNGLFTLVPSANASFPLYIRGNKSYLLLLNKKTEIGAP